MLYIYIYIYTPGAREARRPLPSNVLSTNTKKRKLWRPMSRSKYTKSVLSISTSEIMKKCGNDKHKNTKRKQKKHDNKQEN